MVEEMVTDMVKEEVVVSIATESLIVVTISLIMVVGLTDLTYLIINLLQIKVLVIIMLQVIKFHQLVQQDGVVPIILLCQLILHGTNLLMVHKIPLCLKEKGTPLLYLG